MSDIRTPQNPGIGGLNELTTIEETFIQGLAALSYSTGDILYYSGGALTRLPIGSSTNVLTVSGGVPVWSAPAGGSGTVTSVSITTANGVSGSVATATTTPAITLTLGAITPSTVNGHTFTTGSSTFTGTASQTYTFPSTTSTLVGRATTETLTNKRLTKRVVTVTQAAEPTINTDNADVVSITGLAQAITSMTTNLSGTPVAGDLLIIQITDNGTARAITWGASFASTTVTLPTTTVISTMLRVGFQWNTATSKWDCIATA